MTVELRKQTHIMHRCYAHHVTTRARPQKKRTRYIRSTGGDRKGILTPGERRVGRGCIAEPALREQRVHRGNPVTNCHCAGRRRHNRFVVLRLAGPRWEASAVEASRRRKAAAEERHRGEAFYGVRGSAGCSLDTSEEGGGGGRVGHRKPVEWSWVAGWQRIALKR